MAEVMIHCFQGQIIRYIAISLLLTWLLAQVAVRRGHDKEPRIPAHSLTECDIPICQCAVWRQGLPLRTVPDDHSSGQCQCQCIDCDLLADSQHSRLAKLLHNSSQIVRDKIKLLTICYDETNN